MADELSKVIQNIVVENIVKKHVRKWRKKEYKTLNDMTAAIERDCSQDKLSPLLLGSKAYNDTIGNWMKDKVGADIAQRLMKICERFGVKGLTLDSLNVMKAPDIHIGKNIDFGPLDGILDAISNVISFIAGVVAAAILPTVLGVIIGIIMLISFDFAMLLLGLLLAIPGWGWTLLIAIAGLAVFALIKDGLEADGILNVSGGKEWSITAVRSILTSEKYCGDVLLQKTFRSDCISRKTIRNTGQLPMYLVQNHHEGIVDRKTFDAAQAEMARRNAARSPSKSAPRPD